MIDFIRADHIHICVPPERLEEVKEFYTNILGLQLIDRPNHLFSSAGYWFDIGNIQLHIGVEQPLPPSIRHTAFEVRNIDEVAKHFERHFVKVDQEPEIPGRKRFSFADPFGNRMELLELTDQ